MNDRSNRSQDNAHPVDAVAEILDEIDVLLAKVRNLKSAFDATKEALVLARQAEAIAPEGPWKAVCHYRIAHLLMRQEGQNLEEVERHLAAAIHEPSLGPRPRIYHLALLRRLGRPKEEIEASFHRALEAHAWKPAPEYGEAFFRNDDTFNMLELAAWFSEIPTARLVGYGGILVSGADPLSVKRTNMPWVLLTNIDRRKYRRYTFEMAEDVGRKLLRDHAQAFMIGLSLPGSSRGNLLTAGERWQQYSEGSKSGYEELSLIARLLQTKRLSTLDVEDELGEGKGLTEVGLRQKITRLNKRLHSLMGKGGPKHVLIRNTNGWELSPEVGVVALVEDGGRIRCTDD